MKNASCGAPVVVRCMLKLHLSHKPLFVKLPVPASPIPKSNLLAVIGLAAKMSCEFKCCRRCKAGFETWLTQLIDESRSIKHDMREFAAKILREKEAPGGEAQKFTVKLLEKAKAVQEAYKRFDQRLSEFDSALCSNPYRCENKTEPCESMPFNDYMALQRSSAKAQDAFEKDVRDLHAFEWSFACQGAWESDNRSSNGQVVTTMPEDFTLVSETLHSLLSQVCHSTLVQDARTAKGVFYDSEASSNNTG